MSKVTVVGTNLIIEAKPKESLIKILEKNNFKIESSCSGHGTCGDCVVKIKNGMDNCSPVTYSEIKLLGNVFHMTKERLSCQTKVLGDIEVDLSVQLLKQKVPKNKKVVTKSALRKKSALAPKTPVEEVVSDKNANPPKVKEGGFHRPKRKI